MSSDGEEMLNEAKGFGIKEFERYGTEIPTESGYVKLDNKKYVFET